MSGEGAAKRPTEHRRNRCSAKPRMDARLQRCQLSATSRRHLPRRPAGEGDFLPQPHSPDIFCKNENRPHFCKNENRLSSEGIPTFALPKSCSLLHQFCHNRFLYVHAIFSLVKNHRLRPFNYLIGNLLTAVSRQTVEYKRLWIGLL